MNSKPVKSKPVKLKLVKQIISRIIPMNLSINTANITPSSAHALRVPTSALLSLGLLCLLTLSPQPINAAITDFTGSPVIKLGYVGARNLVKGPEGQPIYAEIDAYGTVHNEIGEAVGATVVSGASYRAVFIRYDELIAALPGQTELSNDGKALYELENGTNTRIQPALISGVINLGLPDPEVINTPDISSVLVSELGNVLYSSKFRIAYRVAMFGLEDGSDAGIGNDKSIIRRPGDTLLGPMSGAVVGYSFYEGWRSAVGASGRYGIEASIPPCPGFSYSHHSFVYLDLYYQNFNPRAKQPVESWGMLQSTSDTCTGYSAGPGVDGVLADSILFNSTANIEYNHNFIVDLLMVSGDKNRLSNGLIPGATNAAIAMLTPTTEYSVTPADYTPLSELANLDLDGDGNQDQQAVRSDGQIAVYLGNKPIERDPATNEPINYDLLRQADTNPDLSHQGLLKQISETDLLDTDILTYREASGERISERNKLQNNALRGTEEGSSYGAGLNSDGSVYFNTPVIWTKLSSYNGERLFETPRASREYSDTVNIVDPAKVPNAWKDVMRPGEVMNTYLINRTTGYLGMSRVQVETNADQGGTLGTLSPATNLLPPNLKIRVERKSNVQAGINKGQTRNQLVGFEGSGLTTDTVLVVTTEWYNHDGSPLPDDLPGYTARLAKVVSNQQLQDVGTQSNGNTGNIVSRFEISPGTHTKTLYIPEDDRPDHFYIHVSGQPISRQADFSASGTNDILGERPAKYVPFKVAVYDEASTLLAKKQAGASGQAEPVYRWVYRPEMQFSVFDFEVQQIIRTDIANATTQNIIDLTQPVIRVTDVIDTFLTLMEPTNDALERFSGDRELILAIGAHEIELSVTDTQITFNDLSHLALLNPEDYLTISQYQNSDSANVLWEYAFELERVMLADFNRNGKIEFTSKLTDQSGQRTDVTTEQNPFVFWVNDDDDDQGSEVNGHDVPDSTDGILWFGQHDHENEIIDGSRDLIDFFAVGMSLNNFINNTPNAENFTYTLKQADNAVNIVYTEMGFDNSEEYLKELNMQNIEPIFGDWQNATTLNQVPTYTVTSDGITLPSEFITLIKDNADKGIFLAEISQATTEPLELIVTDMEGEEVLNAKMYLRSVGVEELYLQISLRGNNRDENSSLWGGNAPPDISSIMNAFVNDRTELINKISDTVDINKHFIHVHGFNNDLDAARAFQSETYKRLYHSGSNALFTGIHWRGDEGLAAGLNYWGNVENAFYTADDLAAVVNAPELSGYKIMAGHSLGNMVIGSAIEDFAMNVDQYFMIDPAVAIEAYDAAQLSANNMRHTGWDNYYFGADYANSPDYTDQAGRRLWSSEWFDLFPDTDERSKLTWRGRFATVLSRSDVVQFYSTGEEVLRQASEGVPSSLTPILDYVPFVDIPIGTNAWNIQEKAKGTSLLAAILAGNSSAGWGFNETCVTDDDCVGNGALTHAEAQTFFDKTNDELTEVPFFEPFDNNGIMDLTVGSDNARISHPHALSYEMPALSYAAGGTLINEELSRLNKAFNMNDIKNGWPQERINTYGADDWWHSDFKSVGYLYTHPLFDEMVNRGTMR